MPEFVDRFDRPDGVRRKGIIAALLSVFAALVIAAPAAATRSLAGNKRAARHDAAARLRSVRLPAGARPSPREPRGDGGALAEPGTLFATAATALAHAWWTVQGRPDATLGYLESHPPLGSTISGSGSACSPTCSQSVIYTWPAIPGVIGVRELAVTVAGLSGGGTGVLVASESDWIVPRPAAEKIPSGVGKVEIVSRTPGGPVTASLTVADRHRVRRLVSLFDAMPIVQPGAIACPAMLLTQSSRQLTFDFVAPTGGRVLAAATFLDYGGPWGGFSGACTPIGFAIRGRPQDSLIGGRFVPRVEGIVGRSLTG